ncbi:MAG: hypothetical protein CSA62_14445 [Planctomycetota bacterium]|nr:MAG: hypothetical protein CSA62_14445 [Planctomycetota bacterium]
MKIKIRNSKSKAKKMSGFRTRMKTHGGVNIIKRRIRKTGKFSR